ncbi:MAG TPA: hypothetical protein VNZ86_07130 [Bacteroidia bacterium]|jgi:hypothetical protein|nr:hypothetical protein [Bacteroidia bacterium]
MNKLILDHTVLEIICAVVATLITWFLKRWAKPLPGTMIVLQMNGKYFSVGIFMSLVGIIFTLGFFQEVAFEFILLFAGIAALGLFSLFAFILIRLEYDEHSIRFRNLQGKSVRMKWKEVQHVTFHAASGMLVLEDLYGHRIRVHKHLDCFRNFVEMIEKKTKQNAEDMQIPLKLLGRS